MLDLRIFDKILCLQSLLIIFFENLLVDMVKETRV